jgi:hypothetical protein
MRSAATEVSLCKTKPKQLGAHLNVMLHQYVQRQKSYVHLLLRRLRAQRDECGSRFGVGYKGPVDDIE